MEKRKKEYSDLKLGYEKRVKLVKEIAELESRILTLKNEIEKTTVPHGLRQAREGQEGSRGKGKDGEHRTQDAKEAKGEEAIRESAQAEAELKNWLVKVKERDRILEKHEGQGPCIH